jgi:DNA topoisomerase-3
MKQMVSDLTKEVKYDHNNSITIEAEQKKETTTSAPLNELAASEKKQEPKLKTDAEIKCPKCKNGLIMKGKNAYGCRQFKEGCHFKINFEFAEKKLSEKQIHTLIQKKKTPLIKGFSINSKKTNGHLILTPEFNIEFIEEKLNEVTSAIKSNDNLNQEPNLKKCPKCHQGILIQGKTAWGCIRFKEGCDYRVLFYTK